jgi:hypothetical protein
MRSMVDQRAVNHRLTERRHRAAEHRWRCYDFGSEVLDRGDWTQHGRDGGHWRRPVSLRADCADVEVTFAVTFAARTNHMIEAYAESVDDPPLLIGQWSDDERRAAYG